MKQGALGAAVALYAVAALGWVLTHAPGLTVPGSGASLGAALGDALLWLRWAAVAALVVYAAVRRELTTWIFVCMLLGAQIGHDLPAVALNLRVVSLVFLRLIKTIIAPLLFATLVSGIAGHADLKQVGRMGLKALVYFEVVTTFALAIGLTAIHVSQAGVGIHLTGAAAAMDTLPTQKLTAAETILHIFPENIAKSVAEGQVLQVVVFAVLFGIALAMVSEARRRPLLAVVESLAETSSSLRRL
jgi:proton glutamate symport protein